MLATAWKTITFKNYEMLVGGEMGDNGAGWRGMRGVVGQGEYVVLLLHVFSVCGIVF